MWSDVPAMLFYTPLHFLHIPTSYTAQTALDRTLITAHNSTMKSCPQQTQNSM